MAFNPDEYLASAPPAKPATAAFDPDAYLAAQATAPAGDNLSTSVRKFFDPGYGSNEPAGMGNVVRQGLKAASVFVPGGTAAKALLKGGALFGLGDSDATRRLIDRPGGPTANDAVVAGFDATKGAASALVGGKALQGAGKVLWKATTWPVAQGAALRQFAAGALAPAAPVAGKVASAAGPAAAAGVLTTEPAVSAFPKLVAGRVDPSESAQTLQRHGVRLTRGQQNPASEMNQLEEAMTSTWPFGMKIRAQRGVGQSDLQVAALNQAIPPGMQKIPQGAEFSASVDAVDQGFRQAYGQVADIPVYPAVHGPRGGPLQGTTQTPGLVERAVDSVQRLPGSARDAIKADVLDQLTRLPPRKGAVGQVAASDLIGVRSVIRGRARELWQDGTAESAARAEAYEAAEGALTSALESQLPRSVVSTLRKTDGAYAKFKTVQKAIISGRSQPSGFTARQLANAASAGQSGVNVGAQNLGPLYDLGLAGADVFQRVSQPTGERVVTLAQAGKFLPGWVQRPLQGGAIAMGNRQAMSAVPQLVNARPALPPAPPWAVSAPPAIPASVPSSILPVSRDAIDAMLRAMQGRLRFGAPVAADEETPRR